MREAILLYLLLFDPEFWSESSSPLVSIAHTSIGQILQQLARGWDVLQSGHLGFGEIKIRFKLLLICSPSKATMTRSDAIVAA